MESGCTTPNQSGVGEVFWSPDFSDDKRIAYSDQSGVGKVFWSHQTEETEH